MWKHKKVAVYTGTRNLYTMMIPAVKSLLINSDVDEIYLYLEDDEFPEKLGGMPKDIVKIRNGSKQKYFPKDGANMSSRFTYMSLIRAALAKEFPDLDRILSLDVDTIIADDISDIWDLPLEEGDGYYFSASNEPERAEREGLECYCNTGVALYNLAKLRDGKCDEVIKILNEKEYGNLEQDVFSYTCQGHIHLMDPIYNSTWCTKIVDNPRIVHYAGEKKWDGKILVKKYAERSWDEVLKYRRRVYGK